MSEKSPITGISAVGESSRTAEFKEARDRLVGKVNSWLMCMALMRDTAAPLKDGQMIGSRPQVMTRILAQTGLNSLAMEETTYNGTSITGDGAINKLKLDAVRTDDITGVIEIAQVTGSDPIAEQFYEGASNTRRTNEVRAMFALRELDVRGERSYKYTVSGTGNVSRRYIDDQGTSAGAIVDTTYHVLMAEAAFDHITEIVV
jgi:hypothetical protein